MCHGRLATKGQCKSACHAVSTIASAPREADDGSANTLGIREHVDNVGEAPALEVDLNKPNA